jgi:hypothetical protein
MNYYIDENNIQYSNEVKENIDKENGFRIGLSLFILLWVFLGIVAFIMSLICFGKSGTLVDKILGLLLAFIFGPFYFFFFAFNKNYCR